MLFLQDLCNANKPKLNNSNIAIDNKSEIYCTKFIGPRDKADYIDTHAPINLDPLKSQHFENL